MGPFLGDMWIFGWFFSESLGIFATMSIAEAVVGPPTKEGNKVELL